MIHIVIGTRAQLLKMAPVMLELEKRKLNWRWIYTAQHKETMDELIRSFGLKLPAITIFNWDTEAKSMGKIWYWFIGIMLMLIYRKREILDGHVGPDNIILTHGDTVTTWWAALLGKLSFCRVMHVEAGLRSFNFFEPFPEEINRIITFILSDYYACPGKWAMDNLKYFFGKKINIFMNTQIDTLQFGMKNANKSDLKVPRGKYAVVSIHRYENVFKKDRFAQVIKLLNKISNEIKLVMPMHPVTKNQLEKFGYMAMLKSNKNIKIVPRLDYLSFIKLTMKAEFVITDGGGNQEELYHMGKPTLIFREFTERQEGIGTTALLSGLDEKKIMEFVEEYEMYKQDPVFPEESPSKIIVDNLVENNFGG